MSFKHRQRIERRIVRRIVTDALDAGFGISIDNGGDELEIMNTTDMKRIMSSVMLADDDRILLHKSPTSHVPFAWVYLVYGNSGWDVINDYTTNIETLLLGANKAADKLEEIYG